MKMQLAGGAGQPFQIEMVADIVFQGFVAAPYDKFQIVIAQGWGRKKPGKKKRRPQKYRM